MAVVTAKRIAVPSFPAIVRLFLASRPTFSAMDGMYE